MSNGEDQTENEDVTVLDTPDGGEGGDDGPQEINAELIGGDDDAPPADGGEQEAPAQAKKPKPPRKPRNSRNHKIELNLQMPEPPAPRRAPAPPPPAPLRPANMYDERRERARAGWYQSLSKLADDVVWFIKRSGPMRDSKKRLVPCGIYADQPMRGPFNTIKVKQLLGGGEYWVTLDDPANPDAEWKGPIDIMGDPILDVSFEPDPTVENDVPEAELPPPGYHPHGHYPGPRGPMPDDPEEWITVFDPKNGIVKRQRKDIEAEAKRPPPQDNSVMIEFLRKQDEQMKLLRDEMEKKAEAARQESLRMMQMLAETLSKKDDGRPDPMAQFIELERARLQSQTEQQKEDLKEARAREERIRDEAEKARKHELELAEKKFDADRRRIEEDKKRAEDERKDEKRRADDLQKAMMESLTKDKQNPVEHMATMFELLQNMQQLFGPKDEDGEPLVPEVKEKTIWEKSLEKLMNAGEKVLTPALQKAAEAVATAAVAQGPPIPRMNLPLPQAPQPTPAIQAPQPSVQQPQQQAPAVNPQQAAEAENQVFEALKAALVHLITGLDSNTPPEQVWASVSKDASLIADQIKTMRGPDDLVQQLTALAQSPIMTENADILLAQVRRMAVGGDRRDWADKLFTVIDPNYKRVVVTPSPTPAAPAANANGNGAK
jgi:hypothetical protein